MREIREQIEWFTGQMEAKLRENDHKGGWDDCSSLWLFKRLIEETDELHLELLPQPRKINATSYGPSDRSYTNIIKEAADVANFAMMIADVARKKVK